MQLHVNITNFMKIFLGAIYDLTKYANKKYHGRRSDISLLYSSCATFEPKLVGRDYCN